MTGNPFAPKMTETQREEAMRRYGRGESLNRIAKDYRIGSAALTKTLKKRGLVLRGKKFRQQHISPDLERKIITDYAAGKAVARIAAEHGVSTGIAGRTIKDSGAHKPAQIRRSTGWTKRRFKEELNRLAEKLGRIPTTSDWYKSRLPSAISFTYKWKKPWNTLVEEAGLTPRVKYGWTKERLRQQFLKLLRQGGILPLRESFNHCEQLSSTGVIRSVFGSFRAFLHECWIETGKHSDQDLMRHLHTLHRELGRPLTSVDIKADARVKWWVYVGRFKSLDRACVAAGVPFRRLAQRPTAEDILTMIRSVHASTGEPVSSTSLRAEQDGLDWHGDQEIRFGGERLHNGRRPLRETHRAA